MSGYRSLLNFTGQTAVVTGAAQGLGAEFARALVECGAKVALLDRHGDAVRDTANGLGDNAFPIECDVTDRRCVFDAIERFVREVGKIDVLISNAGIHRRVDPLDFEEADVDAIFNVNLKGCLNVCGAVGKSMVQQGRGSIVIISALGGGMIGLGRAGSAYGMSKGGVVALTRDLAAEWASQGVRVNAVAPGWIRTPMTSALQNNTERAARVLKQVPLGRWGEAEDVAKVVLFLASDASSYMSGHTIPVDGGALNVISLG
ncbi:MAG: SDR family oxidoreductase [Pirellulaceae bacterium]|nr:SDR family oxidoreductase [Pirellulaceae bacterium]